MTSSMVLPLAGPGEPVRYVVIDDEPRYRHGLGTPDGPRLLQVGGYGSVDAFLGLQREPCHVVVLDLCLNRLTGDKAVRQGVRAIRELVQGHGHRVLVFTADARPEPVARCVAAGAVGYVSKYNGDMEALATAVDEIGRTGAIVTDALHDALRQLTRRCLDIRLPSSLERTLVLLDRGMTDAQVAKSLHLSPRTVEGYKRQILQIFGQVMESRGYGFRGFADLTHQLGVAPGDLVNDAAGKRQGKGHIKQALAWLNRGRRLGRS